MHCLPVISRYEARYISILASLFRSKPITNLLTNVLIVSVKYYSVRRNVNVLTEAGP